MAEFAELQPIIIEANGMSVAVYKHRGAYYAYLNRCPHQGGPICEGAVVGNTECELGPDRSRVREYKSAETFNIACPWHAVEYDLKTGVCKADSRLRMVRLETAIHDDYVVVKT